MALYRPATNPAALAQSAMSGATSAAAQQSKQTKTVTKKDRSFWEDLNDATGSLYYAVGAVDRAEGLYGKFRERFAYDDVAKAYGEGGFEGIQSNPEFQDYWHSKAVGKFVQDRLRSEQGRFETMQKIDAINDKLYQDFRLQAMDINKMFENGDMQNFMPAMEKLAASAPMPYRLVANNDGTFSEQFRSDAALGFTDTGRKLTPEEALSAMNGVLKGERMVLRGADMKAHPTNDEFLKAARRYMYATIQGNAQNRVDPSKQIPLYDAKGNVVAFGTIQNQIVNYNAEPTIFAYSSKDGKEIGKGDYMTLLQQYGLRAHAPQKPNNVASTNLTDDKKIKSILNKELISRGYVFADGVYFEAQRDEQGNILVDDDHKPIPNRNKPLSQRSEAALLNHIINGGDMISLQDIGRAAQQNAKDDVKIPKNTITPETTEKDYQDSRKKEYQRFLERRSGPLIFGD